MMKKRIWMFALVVAFLAAGCANKEEKALQTTQAVQETQTVHVSLATQAPETEPAKVVETPAAESVKQEISTAAQIESQSYDITKLEDFMASMKEQSDEIKYFIENDAMTQNDMNVKSLELYELWDGALNHLWGELKANMSEDEFVALRDKQRAWITDKEAAVKDAAKEFEGGSMYSMVVNSEAAVITEERVYELYTILKEAVQ